MIASDNSLTDPKPDYTLGAYERGILMLTAYHRQTVSATPLHRLPAHTASKQTMLGAEMRIYRLMAITLPPFNSEPERGLLTLQRNLPLLEYLVQRMNAVEHLVRTASELDVDAELLARCYGLAFEQVRRMLPKDIRQPNNLLRPFVLRAVRGEQIEVHVSNRTQSPLHLALLDDDYGIQQTAEQQHPLASDESGIYFWQCKQTGIYPIFNEACPRALQQRCLLGVLMIEP
jgi:hypothetical protein